MTLKQARKLRAIGLARRKRRVFLADAALGINNYGALLERFATWHDGPHALYAHRTGR